ncbi:MAG: beta-propeller fold lactonase family protein [Candidatus Promineifilaceae bacterium]|nr:beta-propeller fold lactonase family protein [Candidatus Promineifilaceae bacterium]
MKRLLLGLLFTLLALAAVGDAAARGIGNKTDGKVVVANRASGTISVIDTTTDAVVGTYALPGENPAEPMYVVYNVIADQVFVGDRANDQVVAFDPDDFSVEATVDVGEGVFHMWADVVGSQLWVNNDVDDTATVIDVRTLDVLATVPMPADLVAMGGKPHDVIVERGGRYAYITMLALPGPNDYVVQFDTRTFTEVNRAAVGKDPHLSLTQRNNYLYVPAQNSDVVTILDRDTLDPVAELDVAGAHGAGMRLDGRFFYTSNLPGGGADGLIAIDTQTNTVLGSVDTPYAVPHNIALTPDGRKLYLTHSGGASDKVTIYTASGQMPVPTHAGEVTVGFNPFGLAYVP